MRNKWNVGSLFFKFALVLCLFNRAQAQCISSKFIDSLYLRIKVLEPEIRTAILNNRMNIGTQIVSEEKIDSVKLVPIVKLSFNVKTKNLTQPHFNTDDEFAICAISYPSQYVYVYDVKRKQLGLKGNSGVYMRTLVHSTLAQTKKPVFTYLFNIDRHQNDIVGYVTAPCSLIFRQISSSKLLNTAEMLKAKFGSVSIYFEYKDKERTKNYISKEVRKFHLDSTLKDNWYFYSKYFPHDTVTCVQLLVNEVSGAVKLTSSNKETLKKKILETLTNKPSPLFSTFDEKMMTDIRYFGLKPFIVFMNTDVTEALASVLSNEQMKKYQVINEISYQQNSLVEGSLSAEFKGNKEAKNEFVRRNIKRNDWGGFSFKDENYKTGIVIR